MTIADGIPKLDYLHGEPVGSTGGRPRHEVQFETGYYNNGYGARLQGNWRSGTTVDSSAGDLKFSPYFDLDLRLFANFEREFRPGVEAPLLPRRLGPVRCREYLQQPAQGARRERRDAAQLPARPA